MNDLLERLKKIKELEASRDNRVGESAKKMGVKGDFLKELQLSGILGNEDEVSADIKEPLGERLDSMDVLNKQKQRDNYSEDLNYKMKVEALKKLMGME